MLRASFHPCFWMLFWTSHSFEITDDCFYAIQWPMTNRARGLEDLGFGWWWDSGCRRIPQRLLEVARSCKDLGRSGHSILEQLDNCQVKSWKVDASGACSHVYLKSQANLPQCLEFLELTAVQFTVLNHIQSIDLSFHVNSGGVQCKQSSGGKCPKMVPWVFGALNLNRMATSMFSFAACI